MDLWIQYAKSGLQAGAGGDWTNQNVCVRQIFGNQVGQPVGVIVVVLPIRLNSGIDLFEILGAGHRLDPVG